MTVLFGLAALAILLWAAQKYLQADPRKLAAVLKLSGGIALLAFAAFLGLRGEIGVAAPLAAVGLGLLGWLPFGPAGFGAAHAEERGPGLARALGLPRNGAGSRHRHDARRDPGGTARGHAA